MPSSAFNLVVQLEVSKPLSTNVRICFSLSKALDQLCTLPHGLPAKITTTRRSLLRLLRAIQAMRIDSSVVRGYRFMEAWDLPGNTTCIFISSGPKLMNLFLDMLTTTE